MDYWEECISEAFEDAGITATKEQLNIVASWVDGAHESYGLATGRDVADANFISDEARELERIKQDIENKRLWECGTKPCKICTTTGIVQDGWGRDTTCHNCDGEGRHR